MAKFVFLIGVVFSLRSFAETLKGTAKNKENQVIYFEKHEIKRDESGYSQFIRVEYSKPDGSVFATMTSDFSQNRNLPETSFEDKRFGSKITLRRLGKSVVFEEFENDKSRSVKTLPIDDTMVASQGFDNFIRTNSGKLASGPVGFKFGILEKKDFFSLTGYQRDSSAPDEIEYGIRASNVIVRLFVDELRVIYDSKKMRLKRFSGRSNILDNGGKVQNVTIDYQWLGSP